MKTVEANFSTYVVINISNTTVPGKLPINAIATNIAVSIIELKNVLPYARMKNVLSELNTFLISEKINTSIC